MPVKRKLYFNRYSSDKVDRCIPIPLVLLEFFDLNTDQTVNLFYQKRENALWLSPKSGVSGLPVTLRKVKGGNLALSLTRSLKDYMPQANTAYLSYTLGGILITLTEEDS